MGPSRLEHRNDHGGSIEGWRVAQKMGHSALSAGHGHLTGPIMRHGKNKKREIPQSPPSTPFPHTTTLCIFCIFARLQSPPPPLHVYPFLHYSRITMSFNKVGRVSTSSANGPTHGSTNASRLRHDQNEPRTNWYASLFACPQGQKLVERY